MKNALIGGLLATGIMVGSVVTTSTSAFAAKGGTARPISVRYHVTGTFLPAPPFTYDLSGPGIGSHLGKGVVTATGDLFGGTTVFAAANGDTFATGNIVVLNIPVVCPPELPFASASDEEIVGGTGRFAGATGTVRITSCAGFAGGGLTVDSVATGTISY